MWFLCLICNSREEHFFGVKCPFSQFFFFLTNHEITKWLIDEQDVGALMCASLGWFVPDGWNKSGALGILFAKNKGFQNMLSICMDGGEILCFNTILFVFLSVWSFVTTIRNIEIAVNSWHVKLISFYSFPFLFLHKVSQNFRCLHIPEEINSVGQERRYK